MCPKVANAWNLANGNSVKRILLPGYRLCHDNNIHEQEGDWSWAFVPFHEDPISLKKAHGYKEIGSSFQVRPFLLDYCRLATSVLRFPYSKIVNIIGNMRRRSRIEDKAVFEILLCSVADMLVSIATPQYDCRPMLNSLVPPRRPFH
uniref:Homoserine kinase n=1 Tax=Talaromyces marneffei PM1 TaxID=1077442 RepID=A0A093VK47_TALMA